MDFDADSGLWRAADRKSGPKWGQAAGASPSFEGTRHTFKLHLNLPAASGDPWGTLLRSQTEGRTMLAFDLIGAAFLLMSLGAMVTGGRDQRR